MISLSRVPVSVCDEFLIKRGSFGQYKVCCLIKKYLLRDSVKYIKVRSVETDQYFIFDQQSNVLRNAHKNYFCSVVNKKDGKVISKNGLLVCVINRVCVDDVPVLYTEEQGFTSFLSDIRNVVSMVGEISSCKEKLLSFIGDNSKDLLALIVDVFSFFLKLLSSESLKLSSLSSFLLDIISVCLRVSAFKDKFVVQSFEISLDSIAWLLAGFGIPTFLLDRIKNFSLLTGKRVFDSNAITSTLFEVLDIFMNVLKWLSVNADPLGVLTFLYTLLNSKFTFLKNYGFIKRVHEIHFRWAKNSQVILEPVFREEVSSLYDEIMCEKSFVEFVCDDKRRMSKVVWDSFKQNIYKFVKSFGTAMRLEPACIIFEGPPGTGKSVLTGNLSDVLSSPACNFSIYPHIIPDINAAKDWYDDYEGQDIMVSDDIGQQGISQWRTIINMVSCIKMNLECASSDKKNTKFFTSRLILGTSNNCSNLHGLSKKDGITDIRALFRRIHDVRVSNVLVNGVVEYKLDYWKFDEVINDWCYGFLPKWQSEATKLNLPPTIQSSDTSVIVEWCLKLVSIVLKVNETVKTSTNFDVAEVNRLGKFFVDLQMKEESCDAYYDCSDEDVCLLKVRKSEDQSWISICEEIFVYVKDLFFSIFSKFRNILVSQFLCLTGISKVSDWKVLWKDEFCDICFDDIKVQCCGCEKPLFSIISLLVGFSIFGFLVALVYRPIKNWLSSSDAKRCVDDFRKIECFSQGQEHISRFSAVNHAPNLVRFLQIRRRITDNDGRELTSTSFGHGVVSGRRILTNYHYKGTEMTVTISRNWDTLKNEVFEFENVPVKVIASDSRWDWMVLEMQSAFKYPYPVARSMFAELGTFMSNKVSVCYFVNPNDSVLINDNLNRRVKGTVVISAPYKEFAREVKGEDCLVYGITAAGLCGCPIIDNRGTLIGLHCSGNDDLGIAMMFDQGVLNVIKDLMVCDLLPVSVVERSLRKDLPDDHAGRRYESDGLKSSVPISKSSLISTGVCLSEELQEELCELGVKYPAAFVNSDGKSLLKTVAMKSFGKTADSMCHDDLDFIRDVLDSILPASFDDLSDLDTVFGNEDVPCINKDSVNGYGYDSQDKTDYFDFENKVISSRFYDIYEKFVEECESDTVEIESILSKEAMKDELRVSEKVMKPRTFRVMPLHHTFGLKKCLGGLMGHIKRDMWFNGVCIGFNPYLDFDKLYNKLSNLNCFDGDFGNWDGACNPMLQDLLNECVFKRYVGPNKKMLLVLLDSIVRTPVLIKEELYYTTHSMPSGAWVTALFNSLLNRCLTALLYSRMCGFKGVRRNINDFFSIRDFVMGDDKIVGVPNKLKGLINAFTMKDLAESLNMKYTDGSKGEIVSEFKDLKDCCFLKRSFRYHSQLKKIVGCLSFQTLLNTVLWFDGRKCVNDVVQGKFTAVQYECYLHERYELVEHLIKEYTRLSYPYIKFSFPHIRKTMEIPETYGWVMNQTGKFFE